MTNSIGPSDTFIVRDWRTNYTIYGSNVIAWVIANGGGGGGGTNGGLPVVAGNNSIMVVSNSTQFTIYGGVGLTNFITSVTNGNGNAATFLNGVGGYTVPAGSGGTPTFNNAQFNSSAGFTNLAKGAIDTTNINGSVTNTINILAGNIFALSSGIEITNFYQGGDGTNWQPAFQRAVNQGLAQGGIKVHVPPGVYGFNSGFQSMTNLNTGTCLAQILFPVLDQHGAPAITIEFDGDVAPPFNVEWPTNQVGLPTYGAIICTTNVPATYPATMFGFPTALTTSFGNSAVNIVMNNLLIQTYKDPGMDAINLRFAGAASKISNIQVDAAPLWTISTAPTGTVHGVVMPGVNNFLPVGADTVSVSGYPVGFTGGEHMTADNIMTWRCGIGIEIPDLLQNLTIRNATVVACTTDLWCSAQFSTSIEDVNIMNFDYEHPNGAAGMPAWTTTTKSIADPRGFLRGVMAFGGVSTGGTVGDLVSPDVSTNLSLVSLYSPDAITMHPTGNANYGPIDLGGNASDASRVYPGWTSYLNSGFGKVLIGQFGQDGMVFDNIGSTIRYGVFSNWNWNDLGNFYVKSNLTVTGGGSLSGAFAITNGGVVYTFTSDGKQTMTNNVTHASTTDGTNAGLTRDWVRSAKRYNMAPTGLWYHTQTLRRMALHIQTSPGTIRGHSQCIRPGALCSLRRRLLRLVKCWLRRRLVGTLAYTNAAAGGAGPYLVTSMSEVVGTSLAASGNMRWFPFAGGLNSVNATEALIRPGAFTRDVILTNLTSRAVDSVGNPFALTTNIVIYLWTNGVNTGLTVTNGNGSIGGTNTSGFRLVAGSAPDWQASNTTAQVFSTTTVGVTYQTYVP